MMNILKESNLFYETKGIDYCSQLDLLALTCDKKVLLMDCKQFSLLPFGEFESQHGFPTLASFNSSDASVPSHIVVADNEGPIDVFDIQTKSHLRSYLEHMGKVTGLTWYDHQSYISSSADGTVRFYSLSQRHSYCCLNLHSGV